MNESEFQRRAVLTFHNLKYCFTQDFEEGRGIERLSTGHKAIFKGAAFAAGGIVGALGTQFAKFTDAELISAFGKLQSVCDFAGLRFCPTCALLALFVYADALPDEMLLGRSVVIHDEIKTFRQFNMRLGLRKQPATADVFFVFQDADKALHFRHSIQERCKYYGLFDSAHVLPWCISLPAKSVWPYSGVPFMATRDLKPAQIEASLFC